MLICGYTDCENSQKPARVIATIRIVRPDAFCHSEFAQFIASSPQKVINAAEHKPFICVADIDGLSVSIDRENNYESPAVLCEITNAAGLQTENIPSLSGM
jgi:hypothetical protein